MSPRSIGLQMTDGENVLGLINCLKSTNISRTKLATVKMILVYLKIALNEILQWNFVLIPYNYSRCFSVIGGLHYPFIKGVDQDDTK